MRGSFVSGATVEALRSKVQQAADEGFDAAFVADSDLGDALTVVAALSALTSGILLGVRTTLRSHPAVVGREMTTLDHLAQGRAVLVFEPPFDARTAEAIHLCRAMWRDGTATSPGPTFPVPGAVNRPRPLTPGGPPIALDATEAVPPPDLVELCDLVLVRPDEGREPLGGVALCQIHDA